jgi:hypothetical protein
MRGTCYTHGEMEDPQKLLTEKHEVMRTHGKHACRRDANFTMNHRETGYEVVNWIHLAQNRVQWRNFRFP